MFCLGSLLFSDTRELEPRGGTLSSDGTLLSHVSWDEACVRMEQQIKLHLGLDGICHVPLLGLLLVRVGTTGLHHPYTTRVLLSMAAQHRASFWGSGTGLGWALHEMAALHCQG